MPFYESLYFLLMVSSPALTPSINTELSLKAIFQLICFRFVPNNQRMTIPIPFVDPISMET